MTLSDMLKPRWKHSDEEIRMALVQETTQEALLKRMALEDSSPRVRGQAVQKLQDEEALAQIAQKDLNSEVRRLAVDQLGNQELLIRIAQADSDLSVCVAALSKLRDAEQIASFATNQYSSAMIQAAVGKLDEPQRLWQILTNEFLNEDDRNAALEKLLPTLSEVELNQLLEEKSALLRETAFLQLLKKVQGRLRKAILEEYTSRFPWSERISLGICQLFKPEELDIGALLGKSRNGAEALLSIPKNLGPEHWATQSIQKFLRVHFSSFERATTGKYSYAFLAQMINCGGMHRLEGIGLLLFLLSQGIQAGTGVSEQVGALRQLDTAPEVVPVIEDLLRNKMQQARSDERTALFLAALVKVLGKHGSASSFRVFQELEDALQGPKTEQGWPQLSLQSAVSRARQELQSQRG